jgi:hypothetical protein
MPKIPSANPDFEALKAPGPPIYTHGMEARKSYVPMAFQITSPFDRRKALLPSALVMHVNPANLTINHQHKVERIQTRGGFVEQHWPDDLDDISADGSTGAFMNIRTGLSAVMRRRTIAWDRFKDLYDLYRNNGSLHDPYGNIVLQGNVMLMWDRGTYLGGFRQFDVEETDDTPFAFKISWGFRVEYTILRTPSAIGSFQGPNFQHQNTIPPVSQPAQPPTNPIKNVNSLTTSDVIEKSNAELAFSII